MHLGYIGGRVARDIRVFIEEVSNRHRLHSALAHRPPAEFEANLPPRGPATLHAFQAVTATRP
jgi:hypothetical protein